MQFSTLQGDASQIESACLVLCINQNKALSEAAAAVNNASTQVIDNVFESGDFKGKLASSLLIPVTSGIKAKRLLLVGTGKEALSSKEFIKLTEAIAAQLKSCTATQASIEIESVEVNQRSQDWKAEQLAIALQNAGYKYDQTKSKAESEEEDTSLDTIAWIGQKDVKAAFNKGQAIAQGVSIAKDLGNLPGNICTPSYLAEQAETLAEESDLITTTILDEKELEAMGAGAFVSVAKGSSESGKIIIMQYQGAKDKAAAPHMILGKGITFDTGGISLKPGAGMDEMKYDMCGAASVLGTMAAIAELKPEINVLGMITSAENMPAGHASKPGDVVTTLSGKTVEILNTDAEGRLVLCDALTYGIDNYKPASIVDIATLTGACMMALGNVNSGLFTQDESLATELNQAADYSQDKIWRLPLEDDYQELLDSNFADMANIGGRLAGATTAACFLARFTEGYPWAHLDIAGTAWHSGGKNKGASGRPVPLLVNYLLNK
jgi:leucyl aminopeptidase